MEKLSFTVSRQEKSSYFVKKVNEKCIWTIHVVKEEQSERRIQSCFGNSSFKGVSVLLYNEGGVYINSMYHYYPGVLNETEMFKNT